MKKVILAFGLAAVLVASISPVTQLADPKPPVTKPFSVSTEELF